MPPMSGDSNDETTPKDEDDRANESPHRERHKTLLGHAGELADEAKPPLAGPAARGVVPKRRGKGSVTIPGGTTPQRGKFWGKVSANTSLGDEPTVPIRVAGDDAEEAPSSPRVLDPITQELHLDEIQDVGLGAPPPMRKAPPRPPPTSKRPPTPPRDSDTGAKSPPSRPAPPLRERPEPTLPDASRRPPTKPPPRRRSDPPAPPKRSEPPAPPKRSEPPPAPPKRSESPPAPPKRAEARGPRKHAEAPSPPAPRAETPAPPAARAPDVSQVGVLDEVPMPAPTLRLRSLSELCEAELALKPDAARASRLHFELGQGAGDTASALKAYAAALQHNPSSLPAIRAARALQLELGNVGAAAKLFDAEIALTDDPAHKALLHYEEGCAWLDVAGDHEASRESFRAAAACDPSNVTVLKALQHAELQAKDWSGLADALELEANAVAEDPQHRAAVLVRLARVLERRLRKPEAAIERYEVALSLDPQTPTALAELQRLLFSQGRWRELIAAHEREASLTRDPGVRSQAHWSIGRIYSERLGAHSEAIAALEKAAELSPHEVMLFDELARLYLEARAPKGAAYALERLASAVKRPAEQLSALHRLGELHRRQQGKEREAIRWFEAALAIDPGYAPAIAALDGLYRSIGDWAALARMYVGEGSSSQSSAARAAAYARAADIFDTRLARPEDAVEHYEHALALDPHHEGAFKALVQLHTAAQRHRSLIELYDGAVDIAPREDIAIAYLFKIGAIYEDVLGEHSGATATFLRILDRQPENLSAIVALQRTAETSGRYRDLVDALDREAKLEKNLPRMLALAHRAAMVTYEHLGDTDGALARLSTILERNAQHAAAVGSIVGIYEGLGQPKELLAAYELQLSIVTEGPARVALLVRMAELCERELADADRAVSWYQRALEADPSHSLARAALSRVLRQKGDHKGLAKTLAEEVETSHDPAQTARAALLLGEVHEIHLAKPVDAVVAYKRALEAVPGYLPALEALARVHAVAGAWKELADTLGTQALSLRDPRLQVDAQLRAAALRADRLGRLDDAMAAYDEVVIADTNNVAALLALEGLVVEQGDNERLEALLAVEAEVLGSPRARVAALVEQGRLIVRGGDDDGSATRSVCMSILAAEPGNPWALRALERVARAANDAALMAEVDSRYTETVDAPSLRSHYLTRLGNALSSTNPSAALTAYRSALELAPDNVAALRGLAKVGSALGDASTLVDAYRREAELTRDNTVAADLLVQSAAVLSRLGDRAGAIEDAERALARSPDHEVAAQMTSALLGNNELDRLIDKLSQAAHNARKIARKVALWRRVGELYALGKQDIGVAMTVVKRALVADPEHPEAMLQLAALYQRDAQFSEAAELFHKVVRIDDSKLEAHLGLARIYTDHLPEPAKARRALERVLAAEPTHREALRMQLKLTLDAGDREQAREASERLLEAATDDETRAWALVEIARVELGADDADRAGAALHEAVGIEGLGGEAAKLYRRLAGNEVPWESYVKALRGYLGSGRASTPDEAARVYVEIARVQSSRLNNPTLAFRTLDDALDKVGDNASVVLERAEMLVATGRVQEAVAQFSALVSRSPYLTEGWRGLTQVLQQQGRQAEAAITASPLVLLGEATEVERNLAQNHGVRPGVARPGSFGHTTMRMLSAGGAENDERAASIFAAVADGIAKAFPVPHELYGVRKGDRIKARSGHPIRNELDRLAVVFGVEEVEMYVHGLLGGDVALELSNPPSLMVPGYVAELPEAQRVFLLARPLAAVAAGTQVAFKLPTEDVAMILAASVRRLFPGFEEGDHDEQPLANLQEKLSPSWFSRGRVDEVVQRYYADPVDAKGWAPSAVKTATRAAALLAGDLDACLAAMRYAGLVQGDKPAHKLARRSPLLDDLLRFWASDEADEVRRVAGLV